MKFVRSIIWKKTGLYYHILFHLKPKRYESFLIRFLSVNITISQAPKRPDSGKKTVFIAEAKNQEK